MEEICKALSARLEEAGKGGYKVFYEDDLLDALPEGERNRETLEAALKKLNNGGYVDVKYARGSAFCIAVLNSYAPPAPEETFDCVEDEEKGKPNGKYYCAVCLCAFLGGAIGGGLFAFLGALL